LIGQDDAGRFRRGHDDDPVPIGEPFFGERIDLCQGDARDETPVKRELLPDRRQRFSLEEIPRVLVGAALGLTVRAFRHDALVTEHHGLLRARELCRGEAEPRDPLELGHECVETARHAVVRDERLEGGFIPGARRLEQRTVRGSPDERRVLTLAKLVEPDAEHAAEQLVEHQGAVTADRSLVARRRKVGDFDGRHGRFLVGDDGIARGGMVRHVERRPRPRG